MKKLLFLTYVLSTLVINAQETKEYPQDIDKKTEIKLNAFSLIGISALDVTYERIINQESTFGVAVFYQFGDIESLDFPRKFSTTGFYRWFFTESRVARGFFVEGFGAINTNQRDDYSNIFGNSQENIISDTSFALGLSVGGKFVTKSGFITEVYLGIGRNIISSYETEYNDASLMSRGGVSIGYRF